MAYILKIQNFQSISKLEIEIDKFTVITGKSNIGKSAIRRAIDVVLFNNWDANYLRKGAKTCKISLLDKTTNYKIEIIKGSENSYVLTYPDGTQKKFDKIGKEVPEDIQKLGWSLFQANDETFNLNVTTQTEPLFMVSYKDTTKTKIFNSIFKADIYERAQKLVSKDVRELKTKIKVLEQEYEERKLETKALQERVQEQQELLANIKTIQDKLQVIQELQQLQKQVIEIQEPKVVVTKLLEITDKQIAIKQLFKLVADENSINQELSMLADKNSLVHKLSQMAHKLETISNYVKVYKESENLKQLNSNCDIEIQQIENKTAKLQKLQELNSKIETISLFLDLQEKQKKLNKRLAKLDLYLTKAAPIFEKVILLQDLQNKINEVTEIKSSLLANIVAIDKLQDLQVIQEKLEEINKLQDLQKQQEQLKEKMYQTEKTLSIVEQQLSSFDICPLCGNSMKEHSNENH